MSESPDWGIRLPVARVLDEMRAAGFEATEAGPPGFLPADPAAARALLESRGMRLVGGFVVAVVHDRDRVGVELASVRSQAAWLASAGAEVLVFAAGTGIPDYAIAPELSAAEWRRLFEGLDRVAEIAAGHRLAMAVHPHFGTVIERREHVERLLDGSAHRLCLDTGHAALGGADPVTAARDAGPRVRHVHLKDLDARLARQVRAGEIRYRDAVRGGLYRPLGEGSARIGDVVDTLRGAGYAGWYVLEQDVMLERVPEEGTPDWITRSLSYARRRR